MMNKNQQLSPHFTLGELTKTSFQTSDNNETPLEAIENLIEICEWLENLRFAYNFCYVLDSTDDYETSPKVESIIINQGYRSLLVSKEMAKAGLKPSKTSNHLTGCAVDIRCVDKEHALRYANILNNSSRLKCKPFDELFIEQRGHVC